MKQLGKLLLRRALPLLLVCQMLLLYYGYRTVRSRQAEEAVLRLTALDAAEENGLVLRQGGCTVLLGLVGQDGAQTAAWLEKNRVEAVDLLVLPRADAAGLQAAAALNEVVPVRRIACPAWGPGSPAQAAWQESWGQEGPAQGLLQQEAQLTLGEMELSLVFPAPEDAQGAVMTQVEFGAARLLLLGQADPASTATLLLRQPGLFDLVQLPGPEPDAQTIPLLEATRPRLALVCCAPGEPTGRLENLLGQAGASLYRTAEGELTVRIQQDTMTVEQKRTSA